MPCRDGGPCCDYGAQHVDRVYKDKLDKVTRMLCEILTQHEANQEMTPSAELWAWWLDHKEEDRKRTQAETEAKRRDEQHKRDRIAELENELARLKEQR
jgi:hypothetical protein